MKQIRFKNLLRLKYLDLSYNEVSTLDSDSFADLLKLEYLDMSHNQITYVDEETFVFKTKSGPLKYLRYLNLEHNFIASIGETLFDYLQFETLRLANNRFKEHPKFGMAGDGAEILGKFSAWHLNNNRIETIQRMSFVMSDLVLLRFDSNQIRSIEYDAFLNCRSLESLSVADNLLAEITVNNFYYLFNLKHLNLSHNLVRVVEANSFQNLNKLESLDLNFNRLLEIESFLFYGLGNLKDLFLYGMDFIHVSDQSLHFLTDLSNLYVNESVVVRSKCAIVNSVQRLIQRNISNRFIFYKSLNIITPPQSNIAAEMCEVTFLLLQFKIHLNLKTDEENELFYDTCGDFLVRSDATSFHQSSSTCALEFLFHLDYKNLGSADLPRASRFWSVFTDFSYLCLMILLAMLFGPYCVLVSVFKFHCPCLSRHSDLNDVNRQEKNGENESTVEISLDLHSSEADEPRKECVDAASTELSVVEV